MITSGITWKDPASTFTVQTNQSKEFRAKNIKNLEIKNVF